MRPEHSDYFMTKYPTLFKDKKKEIQFSCGDGWFPYIDKACERLTNLSPEIHIHCLKEKLAGLRIYFTGPKEVLDEAFEITREAAAEVATVCERCGDVGVVRARSWIRVLCDLHSEGAPELCKTCSGLFYRPELPEPYPKNCPKCNRQLFTDEQYEKYLAKEKEQLS